MSKILVTGSNGQLGSDIKALVSADERFLFTDKEDLDICDFFKVEGFCKNNKIDFIINCAAYTAVDKAENDKDMAQMINHKAVENLAMIAKKLDISLIHISTDYVFDGKSYKPYQEDDETDPVNFYGFTKLQGEEAIKKINPKNSIIIRTSWIYAKAGNNFVKTMLKLTTQKDKIGVIFDQIGTPTYSKDLAKAILKIIPKIDNHDVEVYHYSNEGVCSWFDFAQEIIKIKDIKCQINPIHTYEYPTFAKRPHMSLLDKTKIKEKFDIFIPYWKDSLEDFLSEVRILVENP